MSIQYKRAKITMALFGILLGYLLIDLFVVGIDGYLDRINFIVSALVIFLTMVVFFGMLFVTNKTENIVDERDNTIQQKATSVALLITTMFVFLLSIGLFLGYENAGVVPVAWMWIIAYLTFAFAYFSSSAIIVLLYMRDNAN